MPEVAGLRLTATSRCEPVTLCPSDRCSVRSCADPLHAGTGPDLHPGALKDPRHDVGDLRLLLGEDARRCLHERDPAAQVRERLGKLDADRAAAHDQQVLGPLGEVEQGLVVQVIDLVETGERRDRGVRAGSQEDARAPQEAAVDVEGVGGGEPGPAVEEVDALAGELVRRLVLLDPADDVVHVPHDPREVDVTDGAQPPRSGLAAPLTRCATSSRVLDGTQP